jgi:methionyl-tRNA synthetase
MEPWKLVKTDAKRVETIMHIALQITANLSIAMEPFLPASATKLRNMLSINDFSWEQLGTLEILKEGHTIGTPEILFQKIDDSFVETELAFLNASKLENAKEAAASSKEFPPQKPTVSFDDFSKLDIRLGTILEAEKVPKADKLLKLLVDTGIDKRTIVSGIAEHYTPEEIVGKTVSVLLNLDPRKIKGIESQGMVLMAEDAAGKLSFMTPEKGFGAGGEIR